MQETYVKLLKTVVERLSDGETSKILSLPTHNVVPPSRETLDRIMDIIKSTVFPGFFGKDHTGELRSYFIGLNIDTLFSMLREQIVRALEFEGNRRENASELAADLSARFLQELPEIKRLLCTDVEAIYNNDPAVGNYGEVISCYPVVQAMTYYRVAHALLRLNVPVIPRIITELAHSMTGIDIHPGATIGEYFAIDHGTGVVIGETCVIGRHVTLYQGVTLGAKNFSLDSEGHPINIPRHPIVEDHVTVYSNSTILGRITIGHNSVIGGNVWLTHSVAPHSTILQSRATSTAFSDGLGI